MDYLLPRMRLNLWEFEFGIVGVHLANLIARRCTEDLDDLDQLIYTAVAREYRLAEQQLRQYAACTPHVCRGNGISSLYNVSFTCAIRLETYQFL